MEGFQRALPGATLGATLPIGLLSASAEAALPTIGSKLLPWAFKNPVADKAVSVGQWLIDTNIRGGLLALPQVGTTFYSSYANGNSFLNSLGNAELDALQFGVVGGGLKSLAIGAGVAAPITGAYYLASPYLDSEWRQSIPLPSQSVWTDTAKEHFDELRLLAILNPALPLAVPHASDQDSSK
jgi:hypothetical protein